MENKKITKAEFSVFKKGMTNGWVNIVSVNGKDVMGNPFDKTSRMERYKSLGYSVRSL